MSRRGRAARLNEAGADVAAGPPVALGWDDLGPAEQTALTRLNRGHCDGIGEDVGAALIAAGLAIMRPSGLGITRAGRELAIARLLGARDDEGH